MPVNRLPAENQAQPKGPHRCAVLRDFNGRGEGWKYLLEADTVREFIGMDDCTVKTLREVAAAFDMGAQSVKGDWRDNGMPGKPGCWDLAEILAWRINLDAKSKGRHLRWHSEVFQEEFDSLAERFGVECVLEAAERLRVEWDETLAECEAADANN